MSCGGTELKQARDAAALAEVTRKNEERERKRIEKLQSLASAHEMKHRELELAHNEKLAKVDSIAHERLKRLHEEMARRNAIHEARANEAR